LSQPFRTGTRYESGIWSGLKLELQNDRILVSSEMLLQTVSSAIHLGGFQHASHIVNWKVPLDYSGDRPADDIVRQLRAWSCEPLRTVGLMTAAKLTHASITEHRGDRFNMLCCTTLGTRNAARAGQAREVFSAYEAGTINTIVLIDGQLTEAAMVNAIITATEAKSAALQQLGIVEHDTGEIATGTTTDAVVIGVSQRPEWNAIHAYAGAATSIGCAIGEAVYATVLEAGRTQHEP